jgi:hypothetical protein
MARPYPERVTVTLTFDDPNEESLAPDVYEDVVREAWLDKTSDYYIVDTDWPVLFNVDVTYDG